MGHDRCRPACAHRARPAGPRDGDGLPHDREHQHLHVIVNVVHPETGRASSISFSRRKLSRWAEEYEREHGKIYCQQRVENNAKRALGEKVKYKEPEVDLKAKITALYQASDGGEAFRAALAEQGFTLARGKRLVLVDGEGKLFSLSRQIDGATAKEIRAKLGDLDLPDVDTVREQRGSEGAGRKGPEERPIETKEESQDGAVEYFDREQQDQDWQESIIDASIEASEKPRQRPQPKGAVPTPQTPSPPKIATLSAVPGPFDLNRLQDRHLAELGKFYTENTNARLKLEHTLGEQYGKQERTLRREAEHLQSVLENSGRLKRAWLRFRGQIPKDAEQELENMRRTLENIEWRKAEAQEALKADVERRRTEIETRHLEERRALYPTTLDPAHEDMHPEDGFDEDPDFDEDYGPSLDF